METATLQDEQLVADILESAFSGETMPNAINHLIGEGPGRHRRLQRLMRYLFLRGFYQGKVWLSPSRQACLLVEFPDQKPGLWPRLRLAWAKAGLALRVIGLRRVPQILRRQRRLRRLRPAAPHIYPLILGVRPEVRGRGEGLRLALAAMKAYRDIDIPIALETTTPENVRYYEAFGFKVTHRTEDLGYPLVCLCKNGA
ncbi:hypothetical protein OZ410_09395 [Robiginitalea sp. M366]|uniref:hypothetical protein n=1 Tax=Robiginitalea aestuariiviva TaxID=3036903 RepID=UPI00240E2E6A|nr:hypothetical protein [Robiginitalea aestuariiviva]MDG1572529.1 hypothetical protein [Robiginitalea aestuariiviva]